MNIKKMLLCGMSVAVLFATSANAIDTKAKNMILMDYTTGEHLY